MIAFYLICTKDGIETEFGPFSSKEAAKDKALEHCLPQNCMYEIVERIE